ncbi:MAG: TonB-dependent receptor [Flavobacteriaceae bacterium]|nr:TonB-dependent receptor [Flavobacteriaceae bacterium]
MKKIIFIIVLLCLKSTSAQVKVMGFIKDSIGNPLEMANVIALNKVGNGMEDYSITDAKGKYRMSLGVNGIFKVKVSYVGFKSTTFIVDTNKPEKNWKKNITLYAQDNTLGTVELTYEMPVTIKGDTIVYNSDSFTNGTEKKLEDIMEKLPGVEINDEGQIEIEGKVVRKVMVEGKTFFDGDTKLALKNIPADAVDKIEVLKNYNEVGQLRGLGSDEESVAINIRLKEGKKNFWFGDVTAGAGPNNRYLVHPKLFYYSPKQSINCITDINNTGEVPFTFRDYMNFTGGMRLRNSGTVLGSSSGSIGLSMLKNKKAQEIETIFTAVNYSYELNDKMDVAAFGIYSNTDTQLLTNKQTINYVGAKQPIENKTTRTNQGSELAMFKGALKYKPRANFQLDYDLFVKKSTTDELNAIISLTDIEGVLNKTLLDLNQRSDPFSFNQNATMYYTLNDKNIFALVLQMEYDKDKPVYNSISEAQRFSVIPDLEEGGNPFNIEQVKKQTSKKFTANLDYYYVINNKSNVNLTIGTLWNTQKLTTAIHQTLEDGSQLNYEDSFLKNDVNYDFSDSYLGLYYKFITGIFTFTPGAILHHYSVKNTQLGVEDKGSFTKLLPDFYAKIELKKSESIRLRYHVSTSFPALNKLAEGTVYSNYSTLFSGNRNLHHALYEDYSLNYTSFSMFNFTNIFARFNYTKKKNGIKYSSIITGIDRVNTGVNIDTPEDSFSASARYGRRFNTLKVSMDARYSLNNYNNIQNDVIRKTTSKTQSYKARLGTNFKEWPNLEIGYQQTFNTFESDKSLDSYKTHRPFVNLEIIFLKDVTLTVDYSYYQYTNKTGSIDNTYSFLSSNLYYQQGDSNWEFKITASNLLGTKTINEDRFSELYSMSSQYFVQPRYMVLTVKFNL